MGNYWGSIWSDLPPPKDIKPKQKTPVLTSAEIFDYSIIDDSKRKRNSQESDRESDTTEQD